MKSELELPPSPSLPQHWIILNPLLGPGTTVASTETSQVLTLMCHSGNSLKETVCLFSLCPCLWHVKFSWARYRTCATAVTWATAVTMPNPQPSAPSRKLHQENHFNPAGCFSWYYLHVTKYSYADTF